MTDRFVLDTNTLSYLVARRLPNVEARIAALHPDQILVSAISYGEVWLGLIRRPSKAAIRVAMSDFLREIEILPWTRHTADTYAGLRTEMEKSGKNMGSLDMLIAAHALEAGATLVSNDRAFRHVPGLVVEDWTEAGG